MYEYTKVLITCVFDMAHNSSREGTHRERLLPAGSHYGGSDDANVELVLLLLHHVLSQGFGVGVCVGPGADKPWCNVTHDAVIHPPEIRNYTESEKHHTRPFIRLSIQRTASHFLLK